VDSATSEITFGTLLRKLRREANLTQLVLAERAGLTVRTIAHPEGGRGLFAHSAAQLAGALGMTGSERNAFLASANHVMRRGTGSATSVVAQRASFVPQRPLTSGGPLVDNPYPAAVTVLAETTTCLNARFAELRLIQVVVLDRATHASALGEALKAGGLPCAEITFRAEAAEEAIRTLARDKDMLVGAGTVLHPNHVDRVVSAGARYIVSPGFTPIVARQWWRRNAESIERPVFHGALHPHRRRYFGHVEPLSGAQSVLAVGGSWMVAEGRHSQRRPRYS
jgi:transcriptional regulator with XRE-family HTH domain